MIFENYDRTKFEHILIFQGGEKVEKEFQELGVKVYISKSLKKKISLKAFQDICWILKENDVNIIHTHLIKPYAIAGLINILLRKKFIFNYHGIFLKNNPYYSFIEKVVYSVIHNIIYLFNKVNVVLVPSMNSRELLMEETRLFPEPIVYYNGYYKIRNLGEASDDLINRIQTIKENKIIIALIGRLEIDKRVDRAINLMKTLLFHEKNLHLLIFGDGSQKDNLVHLTDKLDLNSYIDFFGYIKEVQALYKFFDIVLFTSDWEGMPLTMWEAMASGVPVVAPDVGGFKELLEENNCGLIYEPGNLNEAEKKIIELLNDEKLRKKMGGNGRNAIESKYNENNFIVRIQEIYLKQLL